MYTLCERGREAKFVPSLFTSRVIVAAFPSFFLHNYTSCLRVYAQCTFEYANWLVSEGGGGWQLSVRYCHKEMPKGLKYRFCARQEGKRHVPGGLKDYLFSVVAFAGATVFRISVYGLCCSLDFQYSGGIHSNF